jgi:hypothetical protein
MVSEITEQEASAYHSSAVQFSAIIVTNLMLINSGALFAFPAYLEKAVPVTPELIAAAGAPTMSFVLGVVLATLCGYVAYINYGCLRQSTYVDHYIDSINLKYPVATELSVEVDQWRIKTLAKLKKKSQYYRFSIWCTLGLGQIFGLGSLAAFVIGCYLTKSAMFIR